MNISHHVIKSTN